MGIKPDGTYVEVGRGLAGLGVEEVGVVDDPLNQLRHQELVVGQVRDILQHT